MVDRTTLRNILLIAALLLTGLRARAQAPLSKPLADFDKLVSQLKPSTLIGEPIRTGDTAVIPFSSVKFELAGGNAKIVSGGGMSAKNVPLGFLIVEGDDVRAELLPAPEEKSGVLSQLLQGILERKVVIMGNGLNIGSASGTVGDLAPLVSGLAPIISGYQTTFLGNALNLGSLNRPKKNTDPAESNSTTIQKEKK